MTVYILWEHSSDYHAPTFVDIYATQEAAQAAGATAKSQDGYEMTVEPWEVKS